MPIHCSGGDWGAVGGLPWEANTGAAVLFTPGNTKGNRGWRLQNYNTSGTGRWAEAGQVLYRYVEIPACHHFQISPFLFPFEVLRGKQPHTHSFAYPALCYHFMPPLDICTFNSLLGHRTQTFECVAGEIFLSCSLAINKELYVCPQRGKRKA